MGRSKRSADVATRSDTNICMTAALIPGVIADLSGGLAIDLTPFRADRF